MGRWCTLKSQNLQQASEMDGNDGGEGKEGGEGGAEGGVSMHNELMHSQLHLHYWS